MEKKITYHKIGDCLIPDLVPPEDPQIGIWGLRRKRFLKHHRDPICTGLLLSGKLKDHLEEIDQSATEMADRLMVEMAQREGLTEIFKAEDQMEWVRRMNGIRHAAEEVVLAELIYN